MKMLFKGRPIVDISREFLNTNGVKQTADAEISDKVTHWFDKKQADFTAAQQKLRQHAHAAPHFEHRTRSAGRTAARKRIADFARDIQVDQKMLSQRLFCPYFTHFRLSVIRNNSRPRTPRS